MQACKKMYHQDLRALSAKVNNYFRMFTAHSSTNLKPNSLSLVEISAEICKSFAFSIICKVSKRSSILISMLISSFFKFLKPKIDSVLKVFPIINNPLTFVKIWPICTREKFSGIRWMSISRSTTFSRLLQGFHSI